MPSGAPNLVFATDPSGSTSDTAALRALVQADIPALPESKITNLVSDLAGKAGIAYVDAGDAAEATARTTALTTALATKADLVGGVIPNAQIPPLAISKPNVVSSQATMLALVAEEGDVAIRTDVNKNFILKAGGNPTQLADWLELLTPAAPVQSVAGKTGTVALVEGDVANLTTDLATLTSAISSEASSRAAADTSEATARANADTAEATARASADTTETNARIAADALSELLSHKDAASGYAGLDAAAMLKSSEFKLTRNQQTGTSYAIQDSDRGKIVEIKNSTAATIVAISIAQAGAAGAFADGWSCTIKVIGSNSALLTPTTSTIEGANVLALPPNATCVIYSDGSNFFVCDPSLAGPTTAFCTVNELEVNSGSGAGTTGVDVAGNVFGWLLWLKAPKFVKHITFKTSTGVAASTAAVGIFDVNGNKIFSTGAQATASSNLQVSVTLGSTYLFLPGSYRVAWTMSSTSLVIYPASANNVGSSLTSVWNAQSIKWFKASGVASSGDLPASLGTFAASALSMGSAIPFVMFEQ
jgi:hypothetical protein